MKRFFVAVAAAVFAAGVCAQAAADVCTEEGASFCQYNTGCYEMSSEYSGVGGVCDAGKCSCAQVIAGCKKDGALYKGVDKTKPGMGEPGYGAGVKCAEAGGTLVGTPPPEQCGGYCKWPTGCEAISTDPAGSYNPAPITSCADAIKNCQENGQMSQKEDCSDVANVKVEYCYWGEGKCYPMNNPDGASSDNPGMTNKEACEAYGHVSQLEDCSDVSSIKVEYCYWGPGECYPMNNPDGASTDNPGMTNKEVCVAYGKLSQYEDCRDVAVDAVRHLGSKAAAAGLKISYAKNRVNVNWNPATKISSGTVQLLNVKGVAVSTAFIKANSSKVSVKLGTVGVPAGMYFVHINAVGQNGKKIVANSAISIVK
jgi:hypothetical protein